MPSSGVLRIFQFSKQIIVGVAFHPVVLFLTKMQPAPALQRRPVKPVIIDSASSIAPAELTVLGGLWIKSSA